MGKQCLKGSILPLTSLHDTCKPLTKFTINYCGSNIIPIPYLNYKFTISLDRTFMTLLTVMEYLCHKWPRICSIFHTSWSFPHSWLIIGFVTRVTRRVPLSDYLSSPRILVGLLDFLFYVHMFCRSLFVHLSLFFWPLCCLSVFDLRILITPLELSSSSS